ncbi:MAG: laccase domain-containing protein [Phycisphaerales bacterium]|nr:laccase domain-containing protein [Phycisphaerales bacterium]
MRFIMHDGRRYAQFETFDVPGLTHAFSTRPDDLSARMDAHRASRSRSREAMLADFGLDPQRLHYCVQAHEPLILIAGASTPFGAHEKFDALITVEPHAALMNFSADCPLLLIYDLRQGIIAQAHASWRCSVARIAQLVIERLKAEFGSAPGDLLAGVGPSAGPCCYEVKEDVRAAAATAGLKNLDLIFPRRDGRMFFDLWSANVSQLTEIGIDRQKIEIAGICTMCRNDLFFSFRREGAGCGHFCLMSAISGQQSAAGRSG